MQRHKSLLRPPAQHLPASISWLLPSRRTAAAVTSISFTEQPRQSLFLDKPMLRQGEFTMSEQAVEERRGWASDIMLAMQWVPRPRTVSLPPNGWTGPWDKPEFF